MMTKITKEKILYEDRLYPPVWVWFTFTCFAWLFYLVFAPIKVQYGIIVSIVLTVLFYWFLWATSPTIKLTYHDLQVGTATIERKFLGKAAGFEGEAARLQRAAKLDATSYQCIRPWADPVVTVKNLDPIDPVPYWIFSLRTPEKFLTSYRSSI